jgi:DNA segregation ATPase FtsK/SpoIIIE, S-DNA-T family
VVARKKRKKSKKSGNWYKSDRSEGILLFAIGLFLLLSLSSSAPDWKEIVNGNSDLSFFDSTNLGGPVGSVLSLLTRAALGAVWCWFFAFWLLWSGFRRLIHNKSIIQDPMTRVLPLWIASSAWLGQTGFAPAGDSAAQWGGFFGYYIANGFNALFNKWGALLFLSFFLITGVLLLLRPWLKPLFKAIAPIIDFLNTAVSGFGELVLYLTKMPWKLIKGIWNIWSGVGSEIGSLKESKSDATSKNIKRKADQSSSSVVAMPRKVHVPPEEENKVIETPQVVGSQSQVEKPITVKKKKTPVEVDVGSTSEQESLSNPGAANVPMPSIELLEAPPEISTDISEEQLNASADLLEETLKSFGVNGTVKDVRPGPVVTTFEYQPAAGVKVNAIVQRADDLALAMRAQSIRMEAPIPGKAAVGIEIPNPVQQKVYMREVLTRAKDLMDKPLSVVLGRDVFGDPTVIDLASLPHLLVAGSTGSGKSVSVNAMIVSLLMRNDPTIVRLMLIDPKMLELNSYNGIPHLLHKVVTEPKKALRALKWLEAQMDFRYRRLAKHSVRNIEGYNIKVKAGKIMDQDGEQITEPMPYYVCFVDELADLMVQLGQEVELPITRLAQKARAVGIHLVLATQRPSVDVLTGVIKANIPSRISFKVVQMNDSRTILDTKGAEKLLGKGDMLYLMPGRAMPMRVHGAFVDVDECDAIAEHWRNYSDTTKHIELTEEKSASLLGDSSGEDALFEQARQIVVTTQQGSTSMLQRKLSVGYARAGRMMDQLEEAGIVGPFVGSKAREVLMTMEELELLNSDDGES